MSTEDGKIENVAFAMIAKNAQDVLPGILRMANELFDEVVVGMDLSSTDHSIVLAQAEIGIGSVYVFDTKDFAGVARNRGLELIRSPWVFVLDSDEKLSLRAVRWLRELDLSKTSTRVDIYTLLRETKVGNDVIAMEWMPRLFRSRLRYTEGLHETPLRSKNSTEPIKAPQSAKILHHKTVEQQRRSNARYTVHSGGAQEGPVKLNIGSGGRPLKGFINIDCDPNVSDVDCLLDITPVQPWHDKTFPYTGCLPWGDNTVDEIIAWHILEHFSYHHADLVVRDWVRVLKPGGRIEIAFPDLDSLAQGLIDKTTSYLRVIQLLYGGQTTPEDRHMTCLNRGWIFGQLGVWGCDRIALIESRPDEGNRDHEIRVEAYKREE